MQSETRALDFQALYESTPGLFLLLAADVDFTILGASDAYLRATQTKREDVVGRRLFDAFPDDRPLGDSGSLRASLGRVKSRRVSDAMAVQCYDLRRRADGPVGLGPRYWSSRNSPVLSRSGELSYITHRLEDVTDFVELGRPLAGTAAEALQAQNDLKHEEIVRMGEAVNQELRLANEQLSQDFEREMDLERDEHQKSDARHRELLSQSQELGAAANKELSLANELLQEESERELSLERGERKKAEENLSRTEEQLRQIQKLEAVGRLAGGVAHDFNNILSVILGYGNILREQMAQDGPMSADMDEILKAGERAADLTRQLLAFSRQQLVEPKSLDLNVLVASMDKMLKRLVGDAVEMRTAPHPTLGRIKADKSHMEQVIMNLVVNARDAMPKGGTLVIETADIDLDEAYARGHVSVKAGPYVMLAVSDTGIGMDARTRDQVFEPFFTTKPPGQGTGLGLSTVYGIVKQAGGNIWVYSELGKGTTFKVYLPLYRGVDLQDPARPALPPAVTGNETVLLAEDDPQVRRMVREILRGQGYQVLEAGNAAQALAISGEHQGVIDLLLTDVIMPGMNGRELMGKLSALRPGVPVLYMSGYTDNVISDHDVLAAGLILLQKPFTPEMLLRKVREALAAAVSLE